MAFLGAVSWMQAALFAGCATKSTSKYYEFADNAVCLTKIPNIVMNLEVLGWPVLERLTKPKSAVAGQSVPQRGYKTTVFGPKTIPL